MTSDLDNFYLKYEEPTRGCLLALRDIILKQNSQITAECFVICGFIKSIKILTLVL